jgi:hypothetical protein
MSLEAMNDEQLKMIEIIEELLEELKTDPEFVAMTFRCKNESGGFTKYWIRCFYKGIGPIHVPISDKIQMKLNIWISAYKYIHPAPLIMTRDYFHFMKSGNSDYEEILAKDVYNGVLIYDTDNAVGDYREAFCDHTKVTNDELMMNFLYEDSPMNKAVAEYFEVKPVKKHVKKA